MIKVSQKPFCLFALFWYTYICITDLFHELTLMIDNTFMIY
jgi:hypothetical protein